MFKESVIKALDSLLRYKGVSIKISKEILQTEHSVYIEFDDYFNYDVDDDKEGLEIYTKPDTMDKSLLVYTLLEMFKNGEADIVINDTATEKNKNFLHKLCESIKKAE